MGPTADTIKKADEPDYFFDLTICFCFQSRIGRATRSLNWLSHHGPTPISDSFRYKGRVVLNGPVIGLVFIAGRWDLNTSILRQSSEDIDGTTTRKEEFALFTGSLRPGKLGLLGAVASHLFM